MTTPAATGRLDGEPVEVWIAGQVTHGGPVVVLWACDPAGRPTLATLALGADEADALGHALTETVAAVRAAAEEDAA